MLIFFLVNFKMSQFGFRSFLLRGYSAWGVSGSPGWFKDSGDLGIQMTIFVSLATGFLLALKGYWNNYKKLFFYFLPVTGIFTIIATSSRGAMLGVIAAGTWFLIKSKLGLKALVGAVIIASIIYALVPERMFQEFEVAGEDATSVMRLALWDFGLEVMREYPMFGIGYSNWVDYCWYMNPYGINNSGRCSVQHNTLVQSVSETGITGFILYASIIIFIFITNYRTRINAKRHNNKFMFYTAHGLDGGLISYLISSFFFSVLFYPIFWVQLALTVALHAISKNVLNDAVAKGGNLNRLSSSTHAQ